MTSNRNNRSTLLAKTGAFTAASVLAAIGLGLAARALPSVDLTSRGDHRLSAFSMAVVDALDEPATLVLAVDDARLDRRALDRVDDVLDAFERSNAVRIRRIDAGAADGPGRLGELALELVERERPSIEADLAAASDIASDLRTLSDRLDALNASLREISADRSVNARRWADQRAAFVRVAASEILKLADATTLALAPVDVPDPAIAIAPVPEALATLDEQLAQIRGGLGALGPARSTAEAALDNVRELAARARERALLIRRPEVARLTEALQRGELAIALSGRPPGDGRPTIAAIELEAMFPPPAVDAGRGLSVAGEAGARAEALFADALAAIADPSPPVVVFVHGQPGRFVTQSSLLREMTGRLRDRGIDIAEWAVAVDPERPGLGRINPGGLRPVVWVVISPDSAAPGATNQDGSTGPSGIDRARTVADAVGRLLDEGASVMLNLNPSLFPTFGSDDPIADLASRFGVTAESGRPVLHSVIAGGRPVIATDHAARVGGSHVIAGAARGLALNLSWPVPLTSDTEPLVTIDDDDAWAESEWIRVWRTDTASRPLLRDPPEFGEGDQRGPFAIGAAIEQSGARAVIVGSNTWMFDARWAQRQAVDGRVVLAAPGNPALFEAAVLWLARKDELIARGVEASSVPRVKPLGDATLTALRWLLIAGVPLLVLGCGGAVLLRRS
ncbi:MAG: hypothetical protein AAGI53_00960 [Planctomycetota bacterium]